MSSTNAPASSSTSINSSAPTSPPSSNDNAIRRQQQTSSKINSVLDNKIKSVGPVTSSSAVDQVSSPTSIMDKVNSFISNSTNYIKSAANTTSSTPATKTNKLLDIQMEPIAFISDNYIIVLGLFIAFVLLILLYFFSKTFNTGRVVDKMKLYELYQKINSYEFRVPEKAEVTLNYVTVASAYNACHMGSQMFSYTSEEILKQILKCGARYIEFNVFADKYGENAAPIIDSGYKRGEWKLMLNMTTFESAVITIAQNAFKVLETAGGAPNPDDPIFLSLNLSTGHNIACLDRIADILVDYLSDRLLGPKYAYQFTTDIQSVKLADLEGKVVIFASSGYEGSKLEELINSSWIDETIETPINLEQFLDVPAKTNPGPTKSSSKELNNIKRALAKDNTNRQRKQDTSNINTASLQQLDIKTQKLAAVLKREFGPDLVDKALNNKGQGDKEDYEDIAEPPSLDDDQITDRTPRILRISSKLFESPGFDGSRIREHNKTGLTIVVPHVEGDYLTRNYDPSTAWDLGCQFVAMNYQEIDTHMDKYITHFETVGITQINQ